jgi:hypothetical protein
LAAFITLMLTVSGRRTQGRTGLRGVDIRPRPFNEFDQTILETQPVALKRIGRVALGGPAAVGEVSWARHAAI